MKNKVPMLIAIVLIISCSSGISQPSTLARPAARQIAFQDLELGVFIHYSIDTYCADGVAPGSTPASSFNPTKLDPEQWVLAAKAMGAAYVVLTARHEQGFCLWPTKTTDYSVKFSPYKNGNGDIVREFTDACRKHGLKVGLYTAPWIDSHWETGQSDYIGGDPASISKLDDPVMYEKALQKEKEQIRELMTSYGSLLFLWDDHFGRSDVIDSMPHGGRFREFYAALTKFAHELQPECLLLGPDIEHVGTEDGRACYPLWNSLNTIDGTNYSVSKTYRWGHNNTGDPLGKFYRPQLACTTTGFSTGGWMWTGPRKPQPIERSMQVYYETIGRGSGLIVNLTPDKRGLIPDDLVAAAREMGDEIRRRFSNPVAQSDLHDIEQVIKFNGAQIFDHIVLMEDLSDGQKISRYIIEAEVDGRWKVISEGHTIGHKRIEHFDPVTATAIRFTVTESLTENAEMRKIALFNTSM